MREHRALGASSISTATPNTPCSTAPTASTTSSRAPRSSRCRRSRSPTMVTCTGPGSSRSRRRRPGSSPIIGMEAYVAPGLPPRARAARAGRQAATTTSSSSPATPTGYQNLVKLSSIGYTEGFYSPPARRPRAARALRRGDHRLPPACMAGEVARASARRQREAAQGRRPSGTPSTFPGRYYLEVQAHDAARPAERAERNGLLARRGAGAAAWSRPTTRTSSAREDHDAHDVLLCIGLGKDRDDPDRMRYDRGPLLQDRAGDRGALSRAARTCSSNTLDDRRPRSTSASRRRTTCPRSRCPPGIASENDLLVTLAESRRARALRRPAPGRVRERLDYELGVITKTGYAGYFLIVADFINGRARPRHPGGPGPRLGRRLAGRLRAAASPTSIRSSSISSSSASSIRSASRCRTSTSTSASSAAAR